MSDLSDLIGVVARTISASADELNRLDAAAGDGDLGNTMRSAANATARVLGALPPDAGAPQLLRSCGAEIARRAPSTSGTLIARGLLAAAQAIDHVENEGAAAPTAILYRAFDAAASAIQAAGKAAPGDRSLLDSLVPAVESLAASAERQTDVQGALNAATEAAVAGSMATADMDPRVGRARWMAERARGTEDAGARLIALVLEAASRQMSETSAKKVQKQ